MWFLDSMSVKLVFLLFRQNSIFVKLLTYFDPVVVDINQESSALARQMQSSCPFLQVSRDETDILHAHHL